MKMIVSYAKLWKLLIDRRIKKTDLKAAAEISPGTYAKLNRDQYVSMDVIGRICGVLACDVGDIMEMLPQQEEDQGGNATIHTDSGKRGLRHD